MNDELKDAAERVKAKLVDEFREYKGFPVPPPAVKLMPTKPDTDIAAELKIELTEAAQSWLEVCTKAKRLGFDVQAHFAINYTGVCIIQQLVLTKQY